MSPMLTALLAAAAYLVATALLVNSALRAGANGQTRTGSRWRWPAAAGCVVGGWLCWNVLRHSASPSVTGLHISISNSALLVSWTMSVLLVSLSLRSRIEAIGVVLFPLTAALGVIAVSGPQTSELTLVGAGELGLQLHILSSLLAYSLLSIALLQAGFLALQNYRLRKQHGSRPANHPANGYSRRLADGLLAAMPPMQSMEIWLFQLITAGFLLLSMSIATGLIFVDDAFAQHLIHKLVFSVAAWLVFAVLLWGRWRHGWRGKRAVRFTLFGSLLLALAYFGAKWVLEILLNTSWS